MALLGHLATKISQICYKFKVVAQLDWGRRGVKEQRLLKVFLLLKRDACPGAAPAPLEFKLFLWNVG